MNLHVPESLGGPGSPRSTECSSARSCTGAAPASGRRSSRTASAPGRCSSPAPTSRRRRGSRRSSRSRFSARSASREPDAGSDVARMKTTAERARRRVRPQRLEDLHHQRRRATWTVVFAKTDPTKGHRGISAFVVPMDTPGVQIEKHLDKMGQRSTDTSAFALTDVVVPVENRHRRGGRRLQDRHEDAGLHATGHRGRGGRRRSGRLRARRRVREGTRDLRRPDRDAPGRQLPHRRHGDRDRGGTAARAGSRRGCTTRASARRSSRRSRSGSPRTRR